jgi:2-amino-4-hydroxy-6-hydroxymethyldihydropteridine diphosphokinase
MNSGFRIQDSEFQKLAFIALGSNLGDSRKILGDAFGRLQQFSRAPILKSSLWQTTPVDCPPDSPTFLNAVAGFIPRKEESPESLLKKLQALEKEFGRRPKKILNEPRPLDLDLIAFVRNGCSQLAGVDPPAPTRPRTKICAATLERNRAGLDFARSEKKCG